MIASEQMNRYFDEIKKHALKLHSIAVDARKKGYDPEDDVEIKLAENLAERVIGLISAAAPQLSDSKAVKRIIELEREYAPLDWRVAMRIALEIAQERFCKFKDKKEAMEVGIRTGFAYVTLGVVSAPLEGFTSLDIKQRLDGRGEYFCLNYAGPVRAAGGTSAAVSVIIADYVRKNTGYDTYDPTDKEVQRCHAELEDYHEYVTNLQYFPSREECEFLLRNLPVEISGDPSEKNELSSALLKDLPRVPTNNLRSGYCLIHSSCIPLKGPKIWAKIKKWGKEMGMDHWNFMEEFIKVQTKMKSEGKKQEGGDPIYPDLTYIKDLVAGRPVLGYPLRHGAFRLRYGRTRTSGFSGQAIHPAAMVILNNFVATGTQLKVERPGKAAAFSCCDTIDGPIVRLKNGDVIAIESETEAKQHKEDVEEILYIGDVLINYGDFYDRAHKLVPAGYCQEIWAQELEEAAMRIYWTIDPDKLSELLHIDADKIVPLLRNPIRTKISFDAAKQISERLDIPLHPQHIFFWNAITVNQLSELREWIKSGNYEDGKFIMLKKPAKRFLELIGVPHIEINKEFVVVEKDCVDALMLQLGLLRNNAHELLESSKTTLEAINKLSHIRVRDKSGTFIGSRMGRPEKAKMRKLTGSPHTLFPVGEEGGRLRSVQAAMHAGKIVADTKIFKCMKCGNQTPFRVCEICGSRTSHVKYCTRCGESTTCTHEDAHRFKEATLNINQIMENLLKKLHTSIMPDLIKGVRGTANKEHVAEHLLKGMLRAKHDLAVNKDGTIRYDCSEVALTHFRPKEIGVSVARLKQLGYERDIIGKTLERDDQVLELKVQDIILPCSPASPDEPADDVLFRTAAFVDECLVSIYGLKAHYNLKSPEDLVGHLAVGLAPHTSAGIVTRIIGFSKTQAFFAHPYVHAAMRRDCDGDESCILLLLDAFLNFSKTFLPSSRGSTMDAPLVLTSVLIPAEVDDMVFNIDIVSRYPLELYRAADQYKMPNEVKIKRISHVMNTPDQYENMMFTHDTSNINAGVLCSSYKLLPSMGEKVAAQMDLAVKIRAVDQQAVAKLVIEKHFIRDTKGNLRKFSTQQFRCVNCNEKFRRPPLIGKCTKCSGKVIFTISEGSVVKYMDHTINLAEKYNLDHYTKQMIDLTKRRIEGVFGKDKEQQTGLGSFFREEQEVEM